MELFPQNKFKKITVKANCTGSLSAEDVGEGGGACLPSWTSLWDMHRKPASWERGLLFRPGHQTLPRALTFSHHFQSRDNSGLSHPESERLADHSQSLPSLLDSWPRPATNICCLWSSGYSEALLATLTNFQCNNPVHLKLFSNLGFYWFHLLCIFQKFLSVLVCWWNSSWFFSTAMDISCFYVVVSKRFWEGGERLEHVFRQPFS